MTTDENRFLIRGAADSPATRAQLVLVQNWPSELRTRLNGK